MTETWIILGGSSSMARALTRKLAARGCRLVLAGRDMEDLSRSRADCLNRGAAEAYAVAFDARDPGSFDAVIALVAEGSVSCAAFTGSMPAQALMDEDPGLIDGVIRDSFTGPAQFLHRLAPVIEARGAGTVVGIGSVAGDRGRIGNYVYGAAKAGFHTYLSGLRNRLSRSGGHVVTVKPGFTDTAMTWGIEGMFLVASPERVADDILRAVERRRDVIYTPGFWRLVMGIIRAIPERVFKKLSI